MMRRISFLIFNRARGFALRQRSQAKRDEVVRPESDSRSPGPNPGRRQCVINQ
jgi:hypothetical protein